MNIHSKEYVPEPDSGFYTREFLKTNPLKDDTIMQDILKKFDDISVISTDGLSRRTTISNPFELFT